MILLSMSEDEVMKQFTEDFEEIIQITKQNYKKFKKETMRRCVFPIHFKPIDHISNNNNKWKILTNSYERTKNPKSTMFCVIESSFGTHILKAAFVNNNMSQLNIFKYTPHFFSRYSERKNLGLHGMELVIYYFIRNTDYRIEMHEPTEKNSEYIKEIFGTTSDGVTLGVVNKHMNIIFRTFITPEMLKGEQVRKHSDFEKIRKEMYDIPPTINGLLQKNL